WLNGRGFVRKKIAVIGGYTTGTLVPLLKLDLFAKGILAEVFESDYGVHESIIYGRDEALVSFKPDVCYFCVGSDHLDFRDREQEAAKWLRLFEQANDLLGCSILTNTFEIPYTRTFGSFERKHGDSQTNYIQFINERLAKDSGS